MERILERDLQNVRLVRLSLDRAIQVSPTQTEEELIILTNAFIEKVKPTFTG